MVKKASRNYLLVTKKKCKNLMIRARSVHKILSSVNTALCSFFLCGGVKKIVKFNRIISAKQENSAGHVTAVFDPTFSQNRPNLEHCQGN
jgi:hypothetical protein